MRKWLTIYFVDSPMVVGNDCREKKKNTEREICCVPEEVVGVVLQEEPLV